MKPSLAEANVESFETSPAVEDYLKAVYRLEQAGLPGETGRLCEALGGIKPSSVSAMVKRLAEEGLLAYTPYQGVSLTPEGRRISLSVLRRHRLLELYLVRELGYDWEEVHEEAERLEHHLSPRLTERIMAKLGNPEFDPHGDPIPRADGCLPARETISLADCPLGREMLVFRVLDQGPEQLAFLKEHGLMPGSRVSLGARVDGGNSVLARTEFGDVGLDRRAASRILMIRGD